MHRGLEGKQAGGVDGERLLSKGRGETQSQLDYRNAREKREGNGAGQEGHGFFFTFYSISFLKPQRQIDCTVTQSQQEEETDEG
jgi:hypothetical protein